MDGKPFAAAGPEDGIWVAFSSDGVRWQNFDGNPVIAKYSDTGQNVLYDPRIDRYVAFGRLGFGRRLARSESADFERWSEPRLVLACDAEDGPGTQIYGAGIDLYEGLYLGMIWTYREGGDGKIDTQLAVSRDGIRWIRVADRATWLKLGDEDTWEGGMVRSCGRIIQRGDQLYIYYCGVHGEHARAGKPPVTRRYPVMIGLLTQRRDGFLSLDAGATRGTVLTKPFGWPGGKLHINADASRGEVQVEVSDGRGQTIARSRPIRGDQLAAPVDFASDPPAERTPVRLQITARGAKLFSYWFQPS